MNIIIWLIYEMFDFFFSNFSSHKYYSTCINHLVNRHLEIFEWEISDLLWWNMVVFLGKKVTMANNEHAFRKRTHYVNICDWTSFFAQGFDEGDPFRLNGINYFVKWIARVIHSGNSMRFGLKWKRSHTTNFTHDISLFRCTTTVHYTNQSIRRLDIYNKFHCTKIPIIITSQMRCETANCTLPMSQRVWSLVCALFVGILL